MMSGRLIAMLTIALVVSGPSLADDWDDCTGSDPDLSISACTRIIQDSGGDVDPRPYPRVLRPGERGPVIEAVQSLLASRGYDPGTIDGVCNSATHRALLAFRADHGGISVRDVVIRSVRQRDLAVAYYNRGIAHNDKGDLDRAIADYDRALRLKPDDAYTFRARGVAYVAKGEYDRAIADYDKMLRLKPDDASTYGNRGIAYAAKGEYDRAIADYDQALRLDPDSAAIAYRNRGFAYVATSEYDRAIADFDQALRLDPNHARVYLGRGLAYDAKGEYDRAIDDLHVATRMMPDTDPLREQALSLIVEIEKTIASGELGSTAQSGPAMPPARSVPKPDPQVPGRTAYSTGEGAEIEMASLAVDDQERVIAITLNGEIGPGDNKDFAQAAVITDSAMVFLDSPGGDLQAGVDIGKTIWLKKFSTIVPKGSICASACALAWLAGRPRYLAPGALVGFHAPGKANDAESFPDAAGSAMVDGYLSQIGLSASAIAYVNEMKPNEMRWLTTMDAKRLGIRTEIWDSHLEP